jgi:hypothetical protein
MFNIHYFKSGAPTQQQQQRQRVIIKSDEKGEEREKSLCKIFCAQQEIFCLPFSLS